MSKDEWQKHQSKFHDEKKWKVKKDDGRIHEETYDSNKYVSGAKRVMNGTVPMNILHHSFSYDCQRYFNLCVIEPNVVVFASGNILHFLNTVTKKLWFRRGYTGGGIGHVTKSPTFDHIAVGENGIKPPIIIYKWPSMDIVTILYNGTMTSYCHLVYSADGLLLVSQGGHPDYTITFWDWQKSEIALKCKSYNRDVYNITISPSLPGYLATSGLGHIKFWKISETFTGLKLKGEIGKFGQTEISDIVGIVSGCEWGNILLWEEDSITLEICRKNRQPCHSKAITQFEYMNGELISVGIDGWIRIWFYETIDQANPHNGERFLEIQPIYEYHISESDGASAMLMCIRKQKPDNPESTYWYAQDGNGGIWLIDFHDLTTQLPQKIFTCHAGAIADMDNATWGPFVATLSKTGQLHIYNYLEKKLILAHQFNDTGSQVVWFPCQIEATGSTLACAFGSGIIRIIVVAVSIADTIDNIKGDYVRLIQVIKPHKMAITTMSLNPSCNLLVTGGEDSIVFNFKIAITETFPVITPIGFIKVPSGITCLTWKPQCKTTLLIGCSQGDCVEVVLPSTPQPYTMASYELVQCQPKAFKFHSVKSAIQRELIRLHREEEKKEKIAKKREEMERLTAESPGLEINEEEFFDIEEKEPLPEVYIPKIPNKVLTAQYINRDIIWLSIAGFDAGYMYEYLSPEVTEDIEKEPIKSIAIYDADDIEIRSCLFYKERKYLFLGMEHGEIRICRWKPENYTDLSDYWILPMHDNYNGYIPKMILSHDQKMLFTCGYDGNLFSYEINDDTPFEEIEFEKTKGTLSLPYTSVKDIEEIDYASLEEMIQQAEYNRIETAAKQSKRQTLEILLKLSEEYNKIVERNNALPKFHQLSHKELELDFRIIADLNKELDAEMSAVFEKLAFKVEKSELGLQKLLEHFVQPVTCLPFVVCKISKPDNMVYSLRQHILDIDVTLPHIDMIKYIDMFDKKTNENSITDIKTQHYEMENREKDKAKIKEEIEIAKTKSTVDFLKDINYEDMDSSLGIQLNQMLRKYTLRKTRLEQREKEWKVIYNEKPDISVNQTYDVLAIEEAKRTIGDYKLKTSSVFNLLSEERDTLFSKYKELLNCRKKLYYQQEAFNTRLKAVRTEKEHLHTEVLHLIKSLKKIHAEIPLESVKPLPVIPALNINVEFPERKVMVQKKLKVQPTIQDNMKLFYLSDDIENSWEREMKFSRILRKKHEQDCILRCIQIKCENIDKKLDKLEHDRLNIVTENINLNLFLLTLRQEYIILKEYETMENVLHDQVNLKSEEVATVRKKLKKQQKLNNVQVTVLMKLHQLQYFSESQIPFKVHDCVVFDTKKLSKLYARIQQLYEETLELHVKHKDARTHLHRIKLDCNHMRVNNKKLQDEIKLKIMNKFGQSLSLNKLYETILRRIVYDIKANLSETTTYFTKRIKHVKENYVEELSIFNKLLREHTQKLSFLTLLVEEQSKLQKLLKQRIISNEEMLQLEEKYKSDIMKLESILENQMRQKHLFQNDIKNLKLKTKSQYTVQCKEIVSSDKGNNRKISRSFNILVS
ncbi:WD repeat-containing protein 52 [Trachymyrmex cornetzi]|uniref:WD repeat-containing protein 52 n=1 Tax=Trachymyrmex cornetzi TaxID=471704 RepID=A0A195EC60_9HYME|nr:WD repeat-containing protein 52 [Trachymyrmex cornetzi]